MFKNLNPGALGHSLTFDVTTALAKKHGFAGVDLDLTFLGNIARTQSPQAARDWFAATGLRPGGFGLRAAWSITNDEQKYVESLPRVIEDAMLASQLGCTRCTTGVMPRSDTFTFQQQFDLMVRRLKPIASILNTYGIWLGIEFIGPRTLRVGHKYDFVHTMDGMRAVAAAIGTGNIGVLLDAFHLYTAHGSMSDIEVLDAKEVVYVHVNDAISGRSADEQQDLEREMVGATGVIDIRAFYGALRKIGYDGPLTVEPFSPAIRSLSPEEAIATTSAALDKTLSAS